MSDSKRIETDSFGCVEIPAMCYWGAQTQRALHYLSWGTEGWPPDFIHMFGLQKWSAISANASLSLLPHAKEMLQAAEEMIEGKFDNEVPLTIWQSGSGTQIHMNVNEILANRANELLGYPRGKNPIHPNDHVNLGQSSNDTVPTVIHMTLLQQIEKSLLPAVQSIQTVFSRHANQWADLEKVGRTHLQDAVPMTVGEEFSAFAASLQEASGRLQQRKEDLFSLAQGGTAVGTGLNAHPFFQERFLQFLNQRTGHTFCKSQNAFAAQASHDALMALSGEYNTLSSLLYKIANDIRWLSSGPRCGLQEYSLPQNEPGSSFMPGKVNPTQAEALLMVCMQGMGLHHATTLAGIGNFQLNTGKPLIFYNLWTTAALLTEGLTSFSKHCIEGLEPRKEILRAYCKENPMRWTSETGSLGYEEVARRIKEAYKNED